jgi:hypothetical protein
MGDGARDAEQLVGGDVGGAGVEQAAEDAGEGQHVADLVGVVRAARGDDCGVLGGLGGDDLWVGVRQDEDDRVGGRIPDPFCLEDPRQ